MFALVKFKESTLYSSIRASIRGQCCFFGVLLQCAAVYAEPISSENMLQQQPQQFAPIELEDLQTSSTEIVDRKMMEEIYQVAEQAKQEATYFKSQQKNEMIVLPHDARDLEEINRPPIQVNQLIEEIRDNKNIEVAENKTAQTVKALSIEDDPKPEETNIFKRFAHKVAVLGKKEIDENTVQRIEPEVILLKDDFVDYSDPKTEIALKNLKENVSAILSSVTVDVIEDFSSALPQFKELSVQAARAVGFYQANFKFEKISVKKVRIIVQPNRPVTIQKNNIEFLGQDKTPAQFALIQLVPDLDVGDVLNQGIYTNTKNRITETALNFGYFDGYWLAHNLDIYLPQDLADINLKYDTGSRYKLGSVKFQMLDPTQELPLDLDVLSSMVPWQAGQSYNARRVNVLTQDLVNTRYFNYSAVDAIIPDPIQQPLPNEEIEVNQNNRALAQSVINDTDFAGKIETSNEKQRNLTFETEEDQREKRNNALKKQAREDKVIPVIVTLNADKLNNLETGIGYGTDTGARLRTQYTRAIVNRRGHSFSSNFEVSQIRQAVSALYSIPYHHPLNDYINLVGGYEREERKNVAQGDNVQVETAVLGADRFINNTFNNWQHSFGIRYRLDRLQAKGDFDIADIPDRFLASNSDQQESLLFRYEISRVDANRRLNPTVGYRQVYSVEAGMNKLLTDVNMAILKAGWTGLYSFGQNDIYQVIGRANLGYIVTDDFSKVPYNLRFFTGGDQSIRGFDYKSLSPEINGFKVGGQALAVGSLEYNYQFKEGWRAAVFTDFGNAYNAEFNAPATAYGVGVGLIWASPVGPIRVDLASGLSSDEGHPIRLHFFIGSPL